MRHIVHCRVMTDFFVETIPPYSGSNEAFAPLSLGPKLIPLKFIIRDS